MNILTVDSTGHSSSLDNSYSITIHWMLAGNALIWLIVFWRAPRLVARFSQKSGWTQGHFLLKRSENMSTDRALPHVPGKEAVNAYTPPQLALSCNSTPTYPPHLRACWTHMQPLNHFLQRRVVPGYSLGQFSLVFFYILVLTGVSLSNSNPFTDPVREGWLVMAQIPFIFCFSAKNNIVGLLLGMGYERLNFIHRFLARVLVLWTNIHVAGYIYEWAQEETFYEKASEIANIWGFVAWSAVNLMWLFSFEFWRKHAYRVFRRAHILAIVLLLPGVWYHNPKQLPFLVVAVVIVFFDRLTRMVKSHVTEATLTPIPELGMTKVSVLSLTRGWRSGQHVRLRVISYKMGALGWAEIHPFTIASASESQEGITLLCKKVGCWTERLYHIASTTTGSSVKVHIEGPYGGLGHTVLGSFSGALLVVGGSGISFGLSTTSELIFQRRNKTSRVQIVNLVWSVRTPCSLTPLLPELANLINSAGEIGDICVRVHIFYTRAQPLDAKLPALPDGITLEAGRPNPARFIQVTVDAMLATTDQPLQGLFLGCCGPSSLGDSCAEAKRNVPRKIAKAVGEIELHEEVFGW